MARVSFSAMVYEIVGKLGGSVFQYSYGGYQVHVRNSPRNPQTQYQQLRRGDFGFLAASWRNLSIIQRQTFIDAAVSTSAAFNLFITTNVNLILIGMPIVDTYTPTTVPIVMPVEVVDLSPGTFQVAASSGTTVVPAGSSLLIYSTGLKSPTKIFTNPSEYSPIKVLPAGSDISAPTSILPEYISRYGQITADLRLCIKSVLIDTINGSRGAESISCTISEEMAKFVRLFSVIATVNTAGTGVTTLATFALPANTLTQDGDMITGGYWGQMNANPSLNLAIQFAGSGIQFNLSSTGGASWHIEFKIIRTSSSTARFVMTAVQDGSSFTKPFTNRTNLSALDFTIANNIDFTGEAPISGNGTLSAGYINKELM